MYEKMEQFLAKQYEMVVNTKIHADKKTFFDQAFGAAQYHIFMFPADQQEVEELWNCYKPQFEEIIYG